MSKLPAAQVECSIYYSTHPSFSMHHNFLLHWSLRGRYQYLIPRLLFLHGNIKHISTVDVPTQGLFRLNFSVASWKKSAEFSMQLFRRNSFYPTFILYTRSERCDTNWLLNFFSSLRLFYFWLYFSTIFPLSRTEILVFNVFLPLPWRHQKLISFCLSALSLLLF